MLLLDLLLDEALFLKLKTEYAFNQKTPKGWKNGKKGVVIIIPGIFENYTFFKKIANILNDHGFKIIYSKDLEKHITNIEYSTKILEERITRIKSDNIYIVAHSQGGLVTAYFLNTSTLSSRINKIININTPHKGNILAVLFSKKALPNSHIIRSISTIKHKEKIHNFYSTFDNHTYPNSSLILKGGKNTQINVNGHTKILNADETINKITNLIIK